MVTGIATRAVRAAAENPETPPELRQLAHLIETKMRTD
jgi:hypothetical protein